MKRQLSIIFLFVAGLFTLFSSCERNANVELPDVDSKLALSCFISPQDTIIRAYVARSVPIFSLTSGVSTYQPYDAATVVLSGNNTTVQLVYNQQAHIYEIPASAIQILPGLTYTITVSASQFPTLQAQTKVPAVSPTDFTAVPSITVDSVTYPGYPIVAGDIDYSFTDVAGEVNYYMVNVNMQVNDTSSIFTPFIDFGRVLHNDNNHDGQLIRGIFNINTNLYYDADGIRLFLTTGDYDYYEYHRTILSGQNDGDPFSEPTLVHSNVTNGYGIFSGINTTSFFIPL